MTEDRSKHEVAAFLQRLTAITSPDHIRALANAEERFTREAARALSGYVTISNAFKSFFLETIDVGNATWKGHAPAQPATYTWLFLRMTQKFHTLCGADLQALAGYPFPAFAQLRNVFDTAVISSAVAQKLVSHVDADGLTDGVPFEPNAMKKKRLDIERFIFRQMIGSDSGLSETTRSELAVLGSLFDWETHGHRMLATQSMPWLKREGPLRILPHFTQQSYALFMNRYFETMWMVHRLMPLIRPHAAPLPDQWREQWVVIDQSLQHTVYSLTEDFGKRVGQAFVEFVTAKFPFDATSTLTP